MTHTIENELLAQVCEFLRSAGCSALFPELMFFDRGIDVYGIKTGRPKTSYAVELKLKIGVRHCVRPPYISFAATIAMLRFLLDP
jgi:hypothetical protein